MISRFPLACPGCGNPFIARLGVEPTSGTRFYFPCPSCHLPIRGTIAGRELHEVQVKFDAETLRPEDDMPGRKTVTVNPFVPSAFEADSASPIGAFPSMTLARLLQMEGFIGFEAQRHQALDAIDEMWPSTRMLFHYYLQANHAMLFKVAKAKFGLGWEPTTAHERTTVAYQALGYTTTSIIGEKGNRSLPIIGRFSRKYVAATKHSPHIIAMRERGQLASDLERAVFTELGRFIDSFEAWEMGRLTRFINPDSKHELDQLVLYRDEFSIVRDLFQQGFELACKCLWPLVAAQNSVKRHDPHDFGDVHPPVDTVPVRSRPKNLAQYDKLSSAHKIAYVAQVPGWEPLAEMLDRKRRNTIGHATAHHDLRTGRVVSDLDKDGVTYLNFLGMTFDLFEALSTLTQVLRASRVASSPDFLRGEK